jgi:hypothetical protein
MVHFSDEKTCCREILSMAREEPLQHTSGVIRALISACVSIQIPVKLGVKFVMQTAAMTWSVDHMFCNFEIGITVFLWPKFDCVALFLLQWLLGVEKPGRVPDEEEKQFLAILRELLFEASAADSEQLLAARFLKVIYSVDTLHIWGCKFRWETFL